MMGIFLGEVLLEHVKGSSYSFEESPVVSFFEGTCDNTTNLVIFHIGKQAFPNSRKYVGRQDRP